MKNLASITGLRSLLPLALAAAAGTVLAAPGMRGGVCLDDEAPFLSGCTSISLDQDVVVTTRGRFSCPAAAISAGTIDLSLCTRDHQGPGMGLFEDGRTPIVCLPAQSHGGTGSTSTDTVTNCVSPTGLFDLRNLGAIQSSCPGGGTRTVEGGYDSATGQLDVLVTFTDCIDRAGATHNGTATMQGTLTTPSAGVWVIKDTKAVVDDIVFPDGATLKRSCTLERDGVLDESTHTFQGKSTRNNCSLDGTIRYHGGVIDQLLDNATEMEPF